MADTTYKYLDPEALGKLKNLSIAARRVVEGFFAGHHRSPQKGFSIEFAEHREYTPGVDPRHIDWRVYGRRDKLYVKQYEEETCLRGYLIVDKSASMGYKSEPRSLSKLEYASFLGASLGYLMAFQHDAVGLMTFDTKVRERIPARQGTGHLQQPEHVNLFRRIQHDHRLLRFEVNAIRQASFSARKAVTSC